jgi:hypothetical protein
MRFIYKTLVLSLTFAFTLTAYASGIKKWVDEDGVVHYGTSVPPQYSQKGHTKLNQRGIEVGRVERAKTEAELEQERELARLRAEQQKLEQEQRARDRVLMTLFHSEDDIMMVRDGKLAQVDAQIKIKQKQLGRLKDRLRKLQGKAAAAERSGRKLNKKQEENLAATKQQLESGYSYLLDKEGDKQRITNRYARDLGRFRQLQRTKAGLIELEAPQKKQVIRVPGAYVCKDAEHCDRLWVPAKKYTQEHANTPIELDAKRILMTQRARKPTEVNITLSRLSKRGAERLFLDVQCMNSLEGQEHCAKDEVKAIQGNFFSYLEKF